MPTASISSVHCSKIWIKPFFSGSGDHSLHGTHSRFMNHANSGSLRCAVCLSVPLLSVGPDSPSSRATNLRRSGVTKLVLKLMRHVNISRQAVCIHPLAGFMFSCNLCLVSRGNSLRPGSWFMVIYGGRCEAWRMYLTVLFQPVWDGDRDKNQMWRHFLEMKYDTELLQITLSDPFGNSDA